MTGIIKRTLKDMSKVTVSRLYKTLVRPHMEYANTLWHPILKSQPKSLKKFSVVQLNSSLNQKTKVTLKECKF